MRNALRCRCRASIPTQIKLVNMRTAKAVMRKDWIDSFIRRRFGSGLAKWEMAFGSQDCAGAYRVGN
jgi:hypothetical protein